MQRGEAIDLEISMIEGRHATMRDVLPLARETAARADVDVPWHLLEAATDLGPSPWSDPIQVWAPELAGSSGSPITVRISRLDPEPRIVWEEQGLEVMHLPTVVIVAVPSGAQQLGITYEWDKRIALPRFNGVEANSDTELLPTLDGRLYSGLKSAIFETDEPPGQWSIPPEMLHDRQPRFRWLFGVANRAGLFVGRIVRRLIVGSPSPLLADPGFSIRLGAEEVRDPDTAGACPRIDDLVPDPDGGPLVVVVHGTFACAVETAHRLRTLCPRARVARFEHDTFLPISDNVASLVEHLERLSDRGESEILLLSHSRGGLVSSQAAEAMNHLRSAPHVTVWTLGTPHFGTPLAGVGGMPAQALGALYRLCARSEENRFRATYLEAAVSYLVAASELPKGIASMRVGSDFLELHRLHARGLALRTWGGRCHPTSSSGLGHGVLLAPAISGFFDQDENDLVVPTASAILDASPAVGDCNHFQYIEKCSLQTCLATYINVVRP
jgi:hypothetical protein